LNVSFEKLKIQDRRHSGKRASASISMVPVLVVSSISVSAAFAVALKAATLTALQ